MLGISVHGLSPLEFLYFLEYSCNKYCDLIGQLEVSIFDRDLQVSDRDLQDFHRDLQVFVTMGMEKMHVETITIAAFNTKHGND